jgi:hypothetical protein
LTPPSLGCLRDSIQSAAKRDVQWLYYALGGGTGHIMRALALARRAARRGVRTRILTNSPRASQVATQFHSLMPDAAPLVDVIVFPSDADRQAIARLVHAELRQFPTSDWLIVDTFPRGLAGELLQLLPTIDSRKALVHRDLNPEYVAWAELVGVVRHYDVVFAPGERGPLADCAPERLVPTEPWLICDAEEMWPPAVARAMLIGDRPSVEPLIVVSGSGRRDESLAAAQQAADWATRLAPAVVRFVSLDSFALRVAGAVARECWPLLRYLRGVDLVIGAGGYHTVHETRAAEVALIAIAQTRQYDRQERRLRNLERVADWSEANARIENWLSRWSRNRSTGDLRVHTDDVDDVGGIGAVNRENFGGAEQAVRRLCEAVSNEPPAAT